MSATRKKVVWDESNLQDNEEYRKLHPVTLHINEPKTPYVEMTEEEKRQFDEEYEGETWDAKANHLAHIAKLSLPAHAEAPPPVQPAEAPVGKKLRPQLSIKQDVALPAVHHEGELKEAEFKLLRKKVYADEGAKFLLQHKDHSKDDEDGQ